MNDPVWPRFQPTSLRLQELQPEAAAGNRDPFLALTTQVKLLAAGGAIALARKLLDLTQAEYPIETLSFPAATRLITAAILAHAPDHAQAWLTMALGATCQITLDHHATELHPAVIRSEVIGNQVRFHLSQTLFRVHTAEMLIGRWIYVCKLINRFMSSPHRIDGSVNISLDDGGSAPGLAFCDSRPGYVLIPDPHYLSQDQYRPMVQDFQAHAVAWDDRRLLAFWRGSTTGTPADPVLGWRSLPRVRLAEIAASHPDLIDAGITNVNQGIDQAGTEELRARGLLRPRVARRDFLQYRYQIDIDGNTSSWDGFFMKLLSGSPVLKVASTQGFRQWYYDRLVPWQHFVPVEPDMSDLIDKIRWLQANDDAARQIGQAARDFAVTLTTDQELDQVAPVIAAAIRAEAAGPVTDLSFTAGSTGQGALVSGWRQAGADGVQPTGPQAVMALAMPPCLGDFVLLLDVAPAGPLPADITVSAGEEIILRQSVSVRRTCYGVLPRRLASPDATFTLLVSTAAPPDGIVLHRAGLAIADRSTGSQSITAPALVAWLNTMPPDLRVPNGRPGTINLRPLSAPAPTPARPLYTWLGTLVYVDDHTGCLRHGAEPNVPKNLVLVGSGDAVMLTHLSGDGTPALVRLRPEGPFASKDQWTPWTGGFTETLELTHIPNAANNPFSLRGAGLFLCADGSGQVTLSRPRRSSWEVFSFTPNRTG